MLVLKKSRKKIIEGDIFTIQPFEGVFYYGKVIKTNLISSDDFIKGMSLIYIYNYKSTKKEEPVKLGSYELLIPPIVVNNQPWIKGYFETLCNQLVSDNEKDVDYGFWDVMERIYVNLLGQPIKREPKYWSYFGLGSYGVVAKEVFKALEKK